MALDQPEPSPVAAHVARGVCRMLAERGMACVTEFPLANGRRADVIAMDGAGRFLIVEVKSCLADFRSDGKWHDYLGFCDAFYFAVPRDFPLDVLPEGHGLMVADAYEAAVLRDSPEAPLHASRRKALLLRFAHAAASRLSRLSDPRL